MSYYRNALCVRAYKNFKQHCVFGIICVSRLQRCASFTSTARVLQSEPSIANNTHTVFNQSEPFVNVDLWQSDRPLQRALKSMTTSAYGGELCSAQTALEQHGENAGHIDAMTWANDAEAKKPILKQFDNYGRRVDVIKYEPAYHKLMELGIRSGATSYGYNQTDAENQLNGHLVRAGLIYMQNQLEPGHCCPLVMTSACIPVSVSYCRAFMSSL